MGQMLTTFLPNREKPDMSPTTTREKPLNGSWERRSITRVTAVTRAELTRAAPGPAMST